MMQFGSMRRVVAVLSGVVLAVGFLAAPRSSPADEPIVLQLSDDIPGAHPLNAAWQIFADQVGKDTGGAVTIKFFPGAQLYNGPRSVEAVATGALALTAASTPTMVGLIPAFESFSLPYFARNVEEEQKLGAPDMPLFQYLAVQAAQKNVVILPCTWWPSGTQGIMIRQAKEVKSLSEIKGMKIRSVGGPTLAEILRQLGATPIDLAPPEVPTALQTGAIDGAMGSFAFFSSALSDSAKGVISTGGLTQAGYYILANKGIWDKIPARYQQVIVRDLQSSSRGYTANFPKLSAEISAKLKSTGHWIYDLTPAETSNLIALTKPLWQSYESRAPAVYEAITASRKRAGL